MRGRNILPNLDVCQPMMMGKWILYTGDILVLAALTLIGFATHGETDLAFLPRMGALFVPLVISWFLVAPWLGLFHPEIASNFKQLWRPAMAILFTAPLAATLRGFILNAPIIPIFVLVLGATTALGMVFWRSVWLTLIRRKK
jgi:hypothetical protein